MTVDPSRKLGRGLNALFEDEEGDEAADAPETGASAADMVASITALSPSPFQPRLRFDADSLEDLIQSIREKGIIQPILVRRRPDDAETPYEIIAGERRWRAAQHAQLHEVPILVRDVDDRETAEIALIENLQRQDLTPLEEAEGYERLMAEFDHTQEVLGRTLGKSRSHVANTLRLLTLPAPIKQMVDQRALSAGHARALLGAENAVSLAEQVVKRGLNVRQTERLVKKDGGKSGRPASGNRTRKDADTLALEQDLSRMLGLAVTIDFDGRGGCLSIRYETLEQLDSLLQGLTQGQSAPADPAAELTAAIGNPPDDASASPHLPDIPPDDLLLTMSEDDGLDPMPGEDDADGGAGDLLPSNMEYDAVWDENTDMPDRSSE